MRHGNTRLWNSAGGSGQAHVLSTDASADDIAVAKAAPSATAPPQPATCTSFEDFVVTKCPLTWNGITLYGTIDGGVT
jgi:hypothetical protein